MFESIWVPLVVAGVVLCILDVLLFAGVSIVLVALGVACIQTAGLTCVFDMSSVGIVLSVVFFSCVNAAILYKVFHSNKAPQERVKSDLYGKEDVIRADEATPSELYISRNESRWGVELDAEWSDHELKVGDTVIIQHAEVNKFIVKPKL